MKQFYSFLFPLLLIHVPLGGKSNVDETSPAQQVLNITLGNHAPVDALNRGFFSMADTEPIEGVFGYGTLCYQQFPDYGGETFELALEILDSSIVGVDYLRRQLESIENADDRVLALQNLERMIAQGADPRYEIGLVRATGPEGSATLVTLGVGFSGKVRQRLARGQLPMIFWQGSGSASIFRLLAGADFSIQMAAGPGFETAAQDDPIEPPPPPPDPCAERFNNCYLDNVAPLNDRIRDLENDIGQTMRNLADLAKQANTLASRCTLATGGCAVVCGLVCLISKNVPACGVCFAGCLGVVTAACTMKNAAIQAQIAAQNGRLSALNALLSQARDDRNRAEDRCERDYQNCLQGH